MSDLHAALKKWANDAGRNSDEVQTLNDMLALLWPVIAAAEPCTDEHRACARCQIVGDALATLREKLSGET